VREREREREREKIEIPVRRFNNSTLDDEKNWHVQKINLYDFYFMNSRII